MLGKNLFAGTTTREEKKPKAPDPSEPNISSDDQFVELVYQYTDRDNFKQVHTEYFEGALAPGDRDRLFDNLDDGEFFIPEVVGLPSFSEDDDERDHPWHTVVEIKDVNKGSLPSGNQPFGYPKWDSYINLWESIKDWEKEFSTT